MKVFLNTGEVLRSPCGEPAAIWSEDGEVGGESGGSGGSGGLFWKWH